MRQPYKRIITKFKFTCLHFIQYRTFKNINSIIAYSIFNIEIQYQKLKYYYWQYFPNILIYFIYKYETSIRKSTIV